MKVAFTGVHPTSLMFIQQQLHDAVAEFTEVSENNLTDFFSNKDVHDVIVIGEQIDNPIKIAQVVHSYDHLISIIIVNDPANFQKIKQALLFTPFIGNTIDCVSNAIGLGLAAVVKNAALRAQQRRSYANTRNITLGAVSNPNFYEKVKSEYLDRFLTEASVAAILMNREGFIQALNRHATFILRTSEKEALGMPLFSFFDVAIQPAVKNFITNQAHTNATQTFVRELEDGIQYLEIKAGNISAQSTTTYKFAIIADITEKLLSQQKIQKQLKELEQTNKSLKHANADLDTFIYTASHDLKAPMANIEGLISILEKKIDTTDPQFSRIFDMLKVSINRFQTTIKDLTEFTHLQKNTSEDVDLILIRDVVEEVQALLQEMINTSEAILELNFKDCCSIRFSRSNFRSIIYNLLSNAIKYRSPNRKPFVRIRAEQAENFFILTVQDNGLGFAKKQQSKLFSMFQRFHTHVEGTGVGLFIVKRIIDNAGGRVEVESEENVGTTFTIYLKQTVSGT